MRRKQQKPQSRHHPSSGHDADGDGNFGGDGARRPDPSAASLVVGTMSKSNKSTRRPTAAPPTSSPAALLQRCVPHSYGFDHASLPFLQPAGLLPRLLPFQRRAVGWMLGRERSVRMLVTTDVASVGDSMHMDSVDETVAPTKENENVDLAAAIASFAFAIGAAPGQADNAGADDRPSSSSSSSLSLLSCPLSHDYHHHHPMFDRIRSMRGGILAEEMGLGKTVEMLALIMLHERPEGFSDVDAESSELLVVKTTIVVTPSVILQQWIAETANHAPHLATHNYTGANSPSDPVLTAEELAQFDLVFVSYEVLRSECAIAMGDSRRSRRFERKYERPTTPLTSILWWRVVLDEAQMVETVGSQAAKMVRLLPRVNAWAVTGTPAPRSQWKDFYGLFLFLDAHPFATTKALSLLGQPRYSGIASLVFRTLMHRNTKKSVGSELVIPAQEQWLAHLPFNAVEKHYYDQLYEKCAELRSRPAMVAPHFLDETNSKAIRWRDKMEIERRAQLRTWLLRLRQVCCHPQVGEQNKRFFGEKIGSMNDVLRRLFNQCLTSVMTSERSLWTLRVQLAQMLEFDKDFESGRNIFFSILKEIRARIEFCQAEYAATKKIVKADSANDDGDSDQDDDDGSPEVDVADTATPGVNPIKEHLMHLARTITSLRAFEHSIVFFIACSYHSSNVEARETEFYEAAEAIRNDILRNARRSVDAAKLKTWKTVGLLPSPTGEPNPTTTHAVPNKPAAAWSDVQRRFARWQATPHLADTLAAVRGHGVLSLRLRNTLQEARALWDAAEAQRAALERWRSRILSLFGTDLNSGKRVDGPDVERLEEDPRPVPPPPPPPQSSSSSSSSSERVTSEGKGDGGDAVGMSADMDVDSRESSEGSGAEQIVTSSSNPPGMDDEKPSGEEYLQGLDVQAELNVLLDEYGKMLNDRRELLNGIVFAQPDTQPVDGQDDEARLLRGALSAKRRTFSLQRGASHLLAVVRALRQQADTVVALPAPEKKLAELAAQAYASGMEIQLEGLAALQKEMDRFRHLGNVRIMYYRQLQRLSDDVEAPDRPEDPRARIAQLQEPLRAAEMKLARETGRFRYLSHLMTREAQAGGGGGVDGASGAAPAAASAAASEKTEECVICKSDLVAVAQLTACGHFYCSDCVRVWIGRFGKCALCQHKISVNEVTPIAMSRPNDRDHNNSSASTVAPAPGLRRWGRGDDGDDDGTLDFGAPRLAPDVIEAIQSIKIDGSYGTKLDFILRHLVYLKQQSALAVAAAAAADSASVPSSSGDAAPSAPFVVPRATAASIKSLVFSQWEQVLDILADGCRRNGIAVVRIDSGRFAAGTAAAGTNASSSSPSRGAKRTGPRRAREEATRRFITDPAVDVMMLNSASQSSGLSLVQATHVFLVEPVARVGLEMQAISRVHRIGQTQKTHVHRHLIAGTVEERVALLSRRSAAGHAGTAPATSAAAAALPSRKGKERAAVPNSSGGEDCAEREDDEADNAAEGGVSAAEAVAGARKEDVIPDGNVEWCLFGVETAVGGGGVCSGARQPGSPRKRPRSNGIDDDQEGGGTPAAAAAVVPSVSVVGESDWGGGGCSDGDAMMVGVPVVEAGDAAFQLSASTPRPLTAPVVADRPCAAGAGGHADDEKMREAGPDAAVPDGAGGGVRRAVGRGMGGRKRVRREE